MKQYKSIIDNKKAIRDFNYCIARYKGKVMARGKVKSVQLSSTRNRVNEILLDTKSIFKHIIPSDYTSVELIQRDGRKYTSKITLTA